MKMILYEISDEETFVYTLIKVERGKHGILVTFKDEMNKELIFEVRYHTEFYCHVIEVGGVKLDGYLALSQELSYLKHRVEL